MRARYRTANPQPLCRVNPGPALRWRQSASRRRPRSGRRCCAPAPAHHLRGAGSFFIKGIRIADTFIIAIDKGDNMRMGLAQRRACFLHFRIRSGHDADPHAEKARFFAIPVQFGHPEQ